MACAIALAEEELIKPRVPPNLATHHASLSEAPAHRACVHKAPLEPACCRSCAAAAKNWSSKALFTLAMFMKVDTSAAIARCAAGGSCWIVLRSDNTVRS